MSDKSTAYRKKHSCEVALLDLIEDWKLALDNHYIVGILSTDMSKAFDSLYHSLIQAKLKAYGIGRSSLTLIDSYFANRYYRVRLGPVTSDWEPATRGCPQGSAFGPLLWNILQNDLTSCVYSNLNMCADDHQFYSADSTATNVHNSLLANAESASAWYQANFLKGNLNKYQTMSLGTKQNLDNNLNIDNYEVKSVNYLKLLGVTIDNNLGLKNILTIYEKKVYWSINEAEKHVTYGY